MAVVIYKCDTCEREIEIPQNINGIEVMSRCVITDGCKGKLVQTGIKTSHVRGKLPEPDPTGLTDWLPRRVFFKKEQEVALRKWKIKHDLGTNPSVQVHIRLVDGTLVETQDFVYTHLNAFEVEIVFPDARSGIVQCFARAAVTNEKREVILTQTTEPVKLLNVTGSGVLSLAVLPYASSSEIKIGFISAVTGKIVYHDTLIFTSQTSPLSSWWKQLSPGIDYAQIYFSGKTWNVLTARVDDVINNHNEIESGSPFFFTNVKKFKIRAVNMLHKTFTLQGKLDPSLLVTPVFQVLGSTGNDAVYHIKNHTFNVDETTTIVVEESIPDSTADGSSVVDYPFDVSSSFVLLSYFPYSSYDKNTNEVIDMTTLSLKNTSMTSQVSGSLYIKETVKTSVFPSISV